MPDAPTIFHAKVAADGMVLPTGGRFVRTDEEARLALDAGLMVGVVTNTGGTSISVVSPCGDSQMIPPALSVRFAFPAPAAEVH